MKKSVPRLLGRPRFLIAIALKQIDRCVANNFTQQSKCKKDISAVTCCDINLKRFWWKQLVYTHFSLLAGVCVFSGCNHLANQASNNSIKRKVCSFDDQWLCVVLPGGARHVSIDGSSMGKHLMGAGGLKWMKKGGWSGSWEGGLDPQCKAQLICPEGSVIQWHTTVLLNSIACAISGCHFY